MVLEHFRAHVGFVGDALAAVRSFRKHLAWYAHGLRGAAAFRAEVNQLDSRRGGGGRGAPLLRSAPADRQAPSEEQDVDYRAALG